MRKDSEDENSPFTMCVGCLRGKGNNQGHSIKIFLGIRNKEAYYNVYLFLLSVCVINVHLVKLSIFEETEATFGYLYRHVMFWKGVMTCSQSVQGGIISICSVS